MQNGRTARALGAALAALIGSGALTLAGASPAAAAPAAPAVAAAPVTQPVDPARLFDSRQGEITVDGLYAAVGRRAAGSTTEVKVAGRAGIPNDASAVFINLTSVIPDGTNYLTAFPCGKVPNVSTLNSPPDDIRANSAFVPVSAAGTICVYTVAATDFIIDVNGYVPAGGTPTGVTPARLFESRPGEKTVDGQYAGAGRRSTGSITEIQVTGRADVPIDATAAVINLTSVVPASTNYLTAFPCGEVPNVSNLNTPPSDIRANGAFVPLSAKGTICVYTVAATDLIVDITGYVPAGGSPTGVPPARLFETRPGEVTVDGQYAGVGRRAAATTTEIQVTGRAGVPANATAALINLTSVIPDGTNYLTAFPCGSLPGVSSLNSPPNDIRANSAFVKLSSRGTVCVSTVTATDFIVDVGGYVAPTPPAAPCSIDGKTVTTLIPGTECDALVAFYKSAGGANWYNNNGWMTATDPCTWYGVICNNAHVTSITMRTNNLSGAIPPEIKQLTELVTLEIEGSSLKSIPTELTEMTSVKNLFIRDSALKTVPATINKMTSLEYLSLAGNELTEFPAGISDVKSLVWLNLSRNSIATIPTSITQLTNLRVLNLNSNSLTVFPNEITQLTNLGYLGLGFNDIETVPTAISNLANLQELDLSVNKLASVPVELGSLIKLERLHLDYNALNQDVTLVFNPLRAANKITWLDLHGNQCLTTTDAALATWLTGLDSGWSDGCPTIPVT